MIQYLAIKKCLCVVYELKRCLSIKNVTQLFRKPRVLFSYHKEAKFYTPRSLYFKKKIHHIGHGDQYYKYRLSMHSVKRHHPGRDVDKHGAVLNGTSPVRMALG